MKVKFTVMGECKGKGRPRATTFNGHARMYTPKDTVLYENLVRYTYQSDVGERLAGAIEMTVKAYFPIPKSISKKKHEILAKEQEPHLKKPDSDNCIKSICDGLQGVAYDDDKQIYKVSIEKYYSDNPRVEVELKEYDS